MNKFVFILFLTFFIVEFSSKTNSSVSLKRRRPCPRLFLPNGRVRNKPRIFAQFSCHPGYLLMGERYSKCVDGSWDSPLPICVKPSCKVPPAPAFGSIYPSYKKAVLTFFCNPHYVLHGPNTTYCNGKNWNTYLPSCVYETTNASINCDFESPDICGWSHSLNHDFTWVRLNSHTPSRHLGTGPRHDHTKGDGESGYYMYIESSYKNENDTAILISPVYGKQTGKKTCLEFYYHMYGSGIGQLRAYVKFVNKIWEDFDWNLVFKMAGNQGDVWHKAFVDLGDLNDDFQIIFEGIRGISYVSDIAIDDVKLIEDCNIEDLTTVTTEIIDTSTIIFESCENRCFKTNESTSITSSSITSCDCDENCQDRSTCCPDFSIFCVLDYTTDVTEDSNDITTIDETTISSVNSSSTTNKPETNEIITQSSFKITTQTPKIITNVLSSSTTPILIQSTTKPTFKSTVYQSTILLTALNPTSTNKSIIKSTTQSIIKSTTQSTTKPTIKSTTQSAIKSTKPTITSTTLSAIKSTKPTIKSTKPTIKSTTKPTIKSIINPTTQSSIRSTQISQTPSTTKKIIKYINDVATFPTTRFEKEYNLDESEEGMIDPKVSDEKSKPSTVQPNNSLTVKAVIICSVAIFVVLTLVFVSRKVSFVRCLKMKKMRSSNGDSQSDVRFLTSDEILDFTLATPSSRTDY